MASVVHRTPQDKSGRECLSSRYSSQQKREIQVNVKVKFTTEQVMKAQRGNSSITMLFF